MVGDVGIDVRAMGRSLSTACVVGARVGRGSLYDAAGG